MGKDDEIEQRARRRAKKRPHVGQTVGPGSVSGSGHRTTAAGLGGPSGNRYGTGVVSAGVMCHTEDPFCGVGGRSSLAATPADA